MDEPKLCPRCNGKEEEGCDENGCNYCAGHYPPCALNHCERCYGLPHASEYEGANGADNRAVFAKCPKCGQECETVPDNLELCQKCDTEFITCSKEVLKEWQLDKCPECPKDKGEATMREGRWLPSPYHCRCGRKWEVVPEQAIPKSLEGDKFAFAKFHDAKQEAPKTITLTRLTSYSQLIDLISDEHGEPDNDADVTPAYLRDKETGELSSIFLKYLGEDDREDSKFYVDFNPNWARSLPKNRDEMAEENEAALARHDEEDTEYFDFDEEGNNDLFDQYEIFIEVKK